jgi:CheY-like chemotaxis protein
MAEVKPSILIVEDDEGVRESLAQVMAVVGYNVRAAADGVAALIEMRQEVPDFVISDLNMPNMSGFELLSVIRRRYPAVRVIAMSGAISGGQLPPGVTADAFYQKGMGVPALLKVFDTLPLPDRRPLEVPNPVWIQRNGHDAAGAEFVTIVCPDCFRTFPKTLDGAGDSIRDTDCIFCGNLIYYGIVEPLDPEFPHRPQASLRYAGRPEQAAESIA